MWLGAIEGEISTQERSKDMVACEGGGKKCGLMPFKRKYRNIKTPKHRNIETKRNNNNKKSGIKLILVQLDLKTTGEIVQLLD